MYFCILFIYLFIYKCLFIDWFIDLLIYSCHHSFIYSFSQSVNHSLTHSFIHVFIHSFIYSIYLCISICLHNMHNYECVLQLFWTSLSLVRTTSHPKVFRLVAGADPSAAAATLGLSQLIGKHCSGEMEHFGVSKFKDPKIAKAQVCRKNQH